MPEFVLNNRTFVLDVPGHKIRFVKGQPTWVPPEAVKAAVAIGAECVDGTVDVLGPEAVEAVPLTAAEKEEQMFAAFEILTERNERDDFDGAGKPSVEALKKIVDFSFTKKEVGVWFQKFRESKAD